MKEKIEQDISNFTFSIDRRKEQIEISKNDIISANEEIERLKEKINEQYGLKDSYTEVTDKLKQEKEEM